MSQRKLHLWCLIDGKTKKMVEGLLFDEARAVVSSLETTALEHWYAWRDDWVDWRRVNEVDGLTEMIFRQSDVAPPPAPSADASQTAFSDIKIPSGPQGLAVQSASPQGSGIVDISLIVNDSAVPGTEPQEPSSDSQTNFTVRTKRRFKKRYLIQIDIGGKTFQSFSRDISVGGINLEDPIPDWIEGNFKVRIGKPNSKKQIELKCSVIAKEGEEDRHRIKILPLQNIEDEKKLEMWIAA